MDMNSEIDGVQLVRPSPAILRSYRNACEETFGHVHNDYILHDPKKYTLWHNTIFTDYQNQERGIDLPPGHVPSATFWLASGLHFLGSVNIRLRLNTTLENYGGHIGVFIRLSERGKGHGKRAAMLALQEANRLGIRPVLFTCTEDNTASLRTLQSLGRPIRSERALTNADGAIRAIWRFWF